MPHPKPLKLKYCHHKSSGRAFAVIDGQFKYLGQWGAQESRDAYDRLSGAWIASHCISTRAASTPDNLDLQKIDPTRFSPDDLNMVDTIGANVVPRALKDEVIRGS
jgi:hypothetical protein